MAVKRNEQAGSATGLARRGPGLAGGSAPSF